MISINKNRRVHDSITKHSSLLAHLFPQTIGTSTERQQGITTGSKNILAWTWDVFAD
jgi:hypothetical protein